jgi:hypothetical protein
MEVKFGKIKPSNNIFIVSSANGRDGNFFASNQDSNKENNNQQKHDSGGRINDYDSTILEDNAYKEMPDEMFKLEHKIGILENSLSKLNSEIEALESFGYVIQLTALKERRLKLQQEIVQLNEDYARLGFSAKLSGQITSAVNFTAKRKRGFFSKMKELFSTKVLAKISHKFNCSQFMKEALSNLSSINSSVDELINIKIPYGETVTRYEKLTAYLNKANVIHSQISRTVSSIAKTEVKNKTNSPETLREVIEANKEALQKIPTTPISPIIRGRL